MVYCCVPLCKSSSRSAKGISFHEFPVTDIRHVWLRKISRQAEGKIQTVRVVCRQTSLTAMTVLQALAGRGSCVSIFLQTFIAGPGKHPWIPKDRSKVCSLHFREDDYRRDLKTRRLKPDAVPSVFADYPVHLQPKPTSNRRPLKRHESSASCSDPHGLDAKKSR